MKFTKLYLLLFLLECNINADQPTQPAQTNSAKQELTYGERTAKEALVNATRTKLTLDNDQINAIYEDSPCYLKDCVELLLQLELEKKFDKNYKIDLDAIPKKLLLVGPPGTGKSTLAMVVARKLNRESLFIKLPLLMNEYQNSGVANLGRLLLYVMDTKKPVVIILDEINIFAQERETPSGKDSSGAAALWLFLDELAKNPNVLVIATANDVTKLPPQLKDRFEGNIIEITGQDNYKRRFELFKRLLNRKGGYLGQDSDLKSLVHKTRDFSYRQIEELINTAYRHCLLDPCYELLNATQIASTDLEYAYKKFQISGEVLQSKLSFDLKNWIKENAPIIQAASTSVNLILLLTSITYVAVTGKSIR